MCVCVCGCASPVQAACGCDRRDDALSLPLPPFLLIPHDDAATAAVAAAVAACLAYLCVRCFGDARRTPRVLSTAFSSLAHKLSRLLRECVRATNCCFITHSCRSFSLSLPRSLLHLLRQSYCLKIKEMDDEEYAYQAMQEPLYRVETGNYEYRLILRCRQEAKKRFASMRADVMVKLELLDQKHVSDMIQHLQRLLSAMARMNSESYEILKANQLFPLDVDLSGNHSFNYLDPNSSPYQDQGTEEDEEEDVLEGAEAAGEGEDGVIEDLMAKEAILDLDPGADVGEANANSNHNKSSNLHDLLSLH